MIRKFSTPALPTQTGVPTWPDAVPWTEGGARLAPHATPYTPQRLIPSQDIVRDTRVSRSARPGAPGTQKLMRVYGDALVCVRQRVSADGLMRMTTVELLVDVAPVRARIKDRDIVGVRVKATEYTLRSQVRGAGGVWDADHRLWRLSYKAARALGLISRVTPLQPV
jgi:hypothetical protein